MAQQTSGTFVAIALLAGVLVGGGVALTVVGPAAPGTTPQQGAGPTDTSPTNPLSDAQTDVTTFQNQSAFEAYVAAGQRQESSYTSLTTVPTGVEFTRTTGPTVQLTTADTVAMDAGGDSGSADPSRIAQTNVQVDTLDEPDIVKTDGRNFYYAPEDRRPYYGGRPVRPTVESGVAPPPEPRQEPQTHVIDASDPAAPEAVAEINTTGKLLQTGDRLVVFESDRIAGYDVSDPENPTEEWSEPLNGSLVTAREQNGTVYVVTETSLGVGGSCPIEPLGADHAVACEDIYRPGTQIATDSTYTAVSLDSDSGAVRDTVSFVGTSDNTVVYMSPDALYVTYTKTTSRAPLVGAFVREEFDRTPDHLRDRVAEIQSYDISDQSKLREIRSAVDQWSRSLPAEERQTVQEEFREGLSEYIGAHQRNLSTTGIVRVDVSDDQLTVDTTGTVPGEPLNQFSMDQYNGTLRIATTIPSAGDADSENDLYTLDAESLDRQGAVTGMGETERIYSVRYVDDTAYVVTFRRIDPFHVVDLSDPDNPEEKGELKLPGFSSYLHPVDEDHVLGIGEEDGQVKTVLFDVSDPENPTIADDKVLDNYFSEVSDTHHAFLMDRKHGVFVLPAGQESIVMDYTNETLSIETTIETDESATRARYVEDSLYVFAGNALTVVDETSWDVTTTLDLTE